MAYKITQERLAALSPTARQLAQIALEEGIWVLVDEGEKCGGAPARGTGALVAKSDSRSACTRSKDASLALGDESCYHTENPALHGGESLCKQIV